MILKLEEYTAAVEGKNTQSLAHFLLHTDSQAKAQKERETQAAAA